MHFSVTTPESSYIMVGSEAFYLSSLDLPFALSYNWSLQRQRSKVYPFRIERLENGRKKKVFLHRALMARSLGLDSVLELDASKVVDHIDGNCYNNTRSNLRLITQEENVRHTLFKPCLSKQHAK